MENRKRNVHLHVMVTPDELAAIHERMAEAGISNAGDSANAKGATNIFSSIFIFKTSFIYPSYLYFIMPVRGHKCCERLVNPVPELRVNMARSGKKRTGRQAPHNGSLPPSSYFATSSESSRSTFDTSPHSFS